VVVRYPASSGIVATGGTIRDITESGTAYRVHRFTASTDFVVTAGSGDVEYLIVGGGGGGGHRGGGNGGEVLQGTVSVAVSSHPVIVGAGGAGLGLLTVVQVGISGSSSSALGLTAAGGTGGAADASGLTGSGPGGDGTGGPGSFEETDIQGGPGLLVTITGSNLYVGAGGGGGATTDATFFNQGGIQGGGLSINSDGSPLSTGQDPLVDVVSCNAVEAWFRIREPGKEDIADPQREFVFLKGSAAQSMLIKYSRASGFTEGGLPRACPTTGPEGDGVVVSSSVGEDETAISSSAATTFTGAGGQFVNVVVSDVPVFGVFPFYIWSYASATGACNAILLHEGVLPGTTSALDQDPTYRVMAGNATALGFLDVTAGTLGDYWEAYGLPNAVHRRGNLGYATAYGTNAAPSGTAAIVPGANASRVFPPENVLGPSRYSGNPVTAPTLVGIGGQFPKGFSTGVMFGGFTAQNVLDTFNLSSSNPRIIAHYPNAREAIFLPWVPNVVPQV
jgi:hypothetical protein